MDVAGFFEDVEDFSFGVLGLLKFIVEFFQGHHLFVLLGVFFAEGEDDEVVELSFLVVLDKELSIFKSGVDLFFVDLSIEDCPISDDGLDDKNLNFGGIFDAFLFIFLDGHVEGHLFGQEIFLDEETRRGKRLR